MVFCCCTTRRGMFVVGAINIFLGILGIITVSSELNSINTHIDHYRDGNGTLSSNSTEIEDLEDEYFLVKEAYFFPSILTLIVGLLTIGAVITVNYITIQITFYLQMLLFILCLGFFLLFFILGYHWVSLLGDLFGGLLQVYFFHVVRIFRQENAKRETV